MKKRIFIGTTACIAYFGFVSALSSQTADKKPTASASPSSTAASTPRQGTRPLPFHGMVSAVDQKAKTFTITGKQASRVFKVTDKTVMTKGAGTAVMKDIVENEEISGSYWKSADGTCEAKMVKLGPTTPGKKTQPIISPTAAAKP